MMARKAMNGETSMIPAVSAQNPPSPAWASSAAASTIDELTSAPGLPTSDFRLPTRPSPSHQVQFVDVGGLAIAEDHQDDGQADPHLGGRHRDHEEGEHLTYRLRRAPHGFEDDEVDVDGRQHQLDREEHHHRVASHQQSVDTGGEQGRGQDQELIGDHTDLRISSSNGVRSRRAMVTPPTRAASRMKPTISKSTTNRPTNASASVAVSVSSPTRLTVDDSKAVTEA